MSRASVAVIVGTRPEVIKMAPVVLALRQSSAFRPILVSTDRHRLDQALAVFDLEPDYDLELMAPSPTISDLTARTLGSIGRVLDEIDPAWVLVQGDTTTAFAAGLASLSANIPVAHVEAGLRSGHRFSPYPKEINRRMIDQLAELLFAPTSDAAARLLREGFAPSTVHVTGNTVVDALLAVRRRLHDNPVAVPGLDEQRAEGKRIVLVTTHRPESVGSQFAEISQALREIARDTPDVLIVYPVHLDPDIDGPVRRMLAMDNRILLLPPLPYLEFISLLERCTLVLTDSGGVQEEAPTFGKPILVLREVTEHPEGIEAGIARLVGTSASVIRRDATQLLRDPRAYHAMAAAVNPYGDGTASRQIVTYLERWSLESKAA
ncbi:MAG TPA: UDP-N-acetylglucosamine 2-epimerase (non-hydrolyzing) [Kofleriaceae bacterium]|nr:UDP-N-acetylglucosamine 2-epimerase (non-hydrolyzing) [Kofleriaceae bacterium]